MTVELDELPANGDRIWLHDAPGSTILADVWCAAAFLSRLDVHLVLTGRSRQGAHPAAGDLLRPAEPPSDVPSRAATLPLFEPCIPSSVADSDPLRAHASWEDLEDRGDPTAGDHQWLEFRRLRVTGREAEVEQLAHSTVFEPHQEARLLLEAATAARYLGQATRAEYLANLASRKTTDPDTLADATYEAWLAVGNTGRTAGEKPVPASADRRVSWHVLDATISSIPQPRHRAAMQAEMRRDPGAAEMWLRLGHLRAARRASDAPTSNETTYAKVDRLKPRMAALVERLDRGEAPEDLAVLDELEPLSPSAATLFRGRCGVQLGRADWVRTCGHRALTDGFVHGLTGAGLSARLVPRIDATTDLLLAVRWLGVLWAEPRHREEVSKAVRALATRISSVDDYILQEVAGRGAHGTVWRALHQPTGTTVAAKAVAETTSSAADFRVEMNVASSLEHPHVAGVLDELTVGPVEAELSNDALSTGQTLVVSEFLAGGTLADRIGVGPWTTIQPVLEQVLAALVYVHDQGIVHRDVKPSNILFHADGSARLADFGATNALRDRIAGTPAYMAPEQFVTADVTPSVDLYGLGVTAWTLCTGAPPFIGPPDALAKAHAAGALPTFHPLFPVPTRIEAWIRRCLAPLGSRFHSARACLDSLRPNTVPLEHMPVSRRLPTSRMLHRGDPPILFDDDLRNTVRDAVREAWRTNSGRRVVVVDATERLFQQLLREARSTARADGHAAPERPRAGALAIVASEAPPPTDQPWVHLSQTPGRTPDETLASPRSLDVQQVAWAVRLQVDVHIDLADRAAAEGLGSVEHALRWLSRWSVVPGLAPSDRGLVATGDLDLRDAWLEETPMNSAVALSTTAITTEMLEDMCGPLDMDALRRIAVPINGTWRCPASLQLAYRRWTPLEAQQEAHRRLALHHHGRQSLIHGLLGADDDEITDRTAVLLASSPRTFLESGFVDDILLRFGLRPAPRVLHDLQALHRRADLRDRLDDPISDAWRLLIRQWRDDPGLYHEPVVLEVLTDERVPAAMRATLCLGLVTVGPPLSDARRQALLEAVEPPKETCAHELWRTIHHLLDPTSKTDVTEPRMRAWLATNRADRAMAKGDLDAAERHLDTALGLRHPELMLNRVLIALRRRDLRASAEAARRVGPLLTQRREEFRALLHGIALADHVVHDGAYANALVERSPPVPAEYRQALVEALPEGRQTRRFRRLVLRS